MVQQTSPPCSAALQRWAVGRTLLVLLRALPIVPVVGQGEQRFQALTGVDAPFEKGEAMRTIQFILVLLLAPS